MRDLFVIINNPSAIYKFEEIPSFRLPNFSLLYTRLSNLYPNDQICIITWGGMQNWFCRRSLINYNYSTFLRRTQALSSHEQLSVVSSTQVEHKMSGSRWDWIRYRRCISPLLRHATNLAYRTLFITFYIRFRYYSTIWLIRFCLKVNWTVIKIIERVQMQYFSECGTARLGFIWAVHSWALVFRLCYPQKGL